MTAPDSQTQLRISRGYHLYPGLDGTWRYRTANDRFVRVGGPGHLLECLRSVLHGEVALDDVLLEDEDAVAFGELLDAARQRGLVAPAATLGRPPRQACAVHVGGDNPVADAVADLMEAAGQVSRGPIDEEAVVRCDVLVSCAGWLEDSAWRALDAICQRHGKPWHMCYVEGTCFVVGPFSLTGRTASYTDTRNRRLAAAPAPDELLAHWRHLDAGQQLAPLIWPSPAGAAVVAGVLANDVLSYLRGDDVPSEGLQLEIDLGCADLRRHPVLPIPPFADATTTRDA